MNISNIEKTGTFQTSTVAAPQGTGETGNYVQAVCETAERFCGALSLGSQGFLDSYIASACASMTQADLEHASSLAAGLFDAPATINTLNSKAADELHHEFLQGILG